MKQPQWFRKVPPFIVQQPERHQKSCHLALLHSLRHGWGQLAHNNTFYRSRPVIWQDERGNWWRITDTSFTKTGKSSSQTWQPRRLPARILKSNRWWPSGASRHFEENLGRHRPASVMKGVYQSYGRLSAQQAGKPLKQNQQIQMLWKNMYANAPEAPAAQNIYSLGTHSITYPQPHLRVMVGVMFYMGIILVRARRQHAFVGKISPTCVLSQWLPWKTMVCMTF